MRSDGFELTIYFAGVCVFTPRRNSEGKIDEMVVSLLATRDPGRQISWMGSDDHAMAVQFQIRNRFSEEPRFPIFTGRHGTMQGLWLLDREDVEIVRVGGRDFETPLDIDDRELQRDEGGTVPNRDNWTSFRWISPLRGVSEGLEHLNRRILDPDEVQPARIGARIHLKHGELRPANFHLAEGGKKFMLWDLGDGEPRAITTVVRHTLQVPERFVRLRAKKFKRAEGARKLTPAQEIGYRYLTLKPSRTQSRFEIWIMSREMQAVARQSLPRLVEPGKTMESWANEVRLLQSMAQPGPSSVVAGPAKYPMLMQKRGGSVPADFVGFGARAERNEALLMPCDDHEMRHVFFPAAAGETLETNGCSPIRT